MNDLDWQLLQLALEAQKHPPATKERQKALTRLISAIQKSGQLYRPYNSLPPDVYADIYAEALQKVFLHICQKIDDYKPERGKVIAWVNFLVSKRFIDVINDRQNKKMVSLDIPNLDNLFDNNANVSQIEEIKEYLEEDPDEIFRQAYVKGCPAASFQALALRYLADQSWEEISKEFNISISTLSSFYQRSLKKFAPRFQEYLAN